MLLSNFVIINAKLIVGKDCHILNNAAIRVVKGKITEIFPNLILWKNRKFKEQIIDVKGSFVGPGFIDMHIHGCGGVDTSMNDLDFVLTQMSKFLETKGITFFQPATCMNIDLLNKAEILIKNKPILKRYIPGFYVEGPFISLPKRGGLPINSIWKPTLENLKLLENYSVISTMTIDPEIENFEMIYNFLIEKGVKVAFGHTEIKYDSIPNKKEYHLTHLFNAMSEINHKTPGLALLPFLKENVTFELVCDGVHVAQPVLEFVFQKLGADNCCIISDGMKVAGTDIESFEYDGNEVINDGVSCHYTKNNLLVGSSSLISTTGINLCKNGLISINQLFKVCSLNPSKILNKPDIGHIEVGCYGDFIILDNNLKILNTIKSFVN